MVELTCDVFLYSLTKGGSKCTEPVTYTLRRKGGIGHYCKYHYDIIKQLDEAINERD